MNKQAENMANVVGQVAIIDDDPVASGMLAVTLEAAGHHCCEMASGEAFMAHLSSISAEQMPEVIFLDIEMPGMDGYEVCKKIKSSGLALQVPVVFLSGHDSLDQRIAAYEAGGDDFISKPFDPAEVLKKASICVRHHRKAAQNDALRKSAETVAFDAITNLGETAIQLKYLRRVIGCHSMQALARHTLETTADFGLKGHVQIRTPEQHITLTDQGPASPLEESVFEKMTNMGRIFSFKNRMIVNHEKISILVVNMPTDNPEYSGRIRDHLAIIAEAGDLAIDNIRARLTAVAGAQEMNEIAIATREAVEEVRTSYREIQMSSRIELETMTNTIEGMYVGLGLTDSQEASVSDIVRGSVENVLALLEQGTRLDSSFGKIVGQLAHTVDVQLPIELEDNNEFKSIELW